MSAATILRAQPGECKPGPEIPPGKKQPRPFAQLPHDIAADPRLDGTAIKILLALLFWARGKSTCYPSDTSIGLRVKRSRATVQRHMRVLEACGYIAREKVEDNATGRLIRLLWREAPPVSKPSSPPCPPVRHECDTGREKEKPLAGRAEPPAAEMTKEEELSTLAEWVQRPQGDPLRRYAERQMDRLLADIPNAGTLDIYAALPCSASPPRSLTT